MYYNLQETLHTWPVSSIRGFPCHYAETVYSAHVCGALKLIEDALVNACLVQTVSLYRTHVILQTLSSCSSSCDAESVHSSFHVEQSRSAPGFEPGVSEHQSGASLSPGGKRV